jgi:uncharacterized protein (DUF952 family)
MTIIFHLTKRADWEARNPNEGYVAVSLEAEGFIHCSEDETQLLEVAHRLFAGEIGLLALEVDTELLTSPLKREPSRSGTIYPHIYGPIDLVAVAGTRVISAGADGAFHLEEG